MKILGIVAITVLAVLAISILTIGITGKTITVYDSDKSRYVETYSKIEIDSLLTLVNTRINKIELSLNTSKNVSSCFTDTIRLFRLVSVINQTSGYSNDKVEFAEMPSGERYLATLTKEGEGSIVIGGKIFIVKYYGSADIAEESRLVEISDSVGSKRKISRHSYIGIVKSTGELY